MDEKRTLADVLSEAASDYYATREDVGLLTSFIFVGEVMRESGDTTVTVSYPDTQSFVQSAGLISLGDEWIKDDMRTVFLMMGTDGEPE